MSDQAAAVATTTERVDVVLLHHGGGHARFLHHAPERSGETVFFLPEPAWERLGRPVQMQLTVEVQCRGCGCTDSRACEGGCSWFEVGLCSRCAS